MKRTTALLLLASSSLLLPFAVQAKHSISFTLLPPLGGFDTTMRSIGKRVEIQLLAANYTGLSSLASPTLYWYASYAAPYNVEITVQSKAGKTVLKKNIGSVKSAGIQAIRLADYGVNLVEGEDYTWSIAVIANTAQPSNLLADANVRYQKTASPLNDITQMITAGYWYDAVSELLETKSPQLQDVLVQEGISIPN
jgi:hypothetical protein